MIVASFNVQTKILKRGRECERREFEIQPRQHDIME